MPGLDPATDKEYDRALLAAQVNPKGLTERQKELMGVLTNESSSRGNRAREAMKD